MSSVIYLDEWREKLETISRSRYPSKQNPLSEQTGQQPTDDEMAGLVAVYVTLQRARINPFTTKSDYARYAADVVALAASEGLISTKIDEDSFGNKWMITEDGIVWMRGFDDAFANRH